MQVKFNFLIVGFLWCFSSTVYGNQLSFGFNQSSLEKIIQFRSKIDVKKIIVNDLSFNGVYQKLKSNEICIGILPTDLTYQYLLFGHPGEIKGKFSGDSVIEVDLNNSKSNITGLTMGGHVELIAKDVGKNKLVNMPQQRINDILSGKIHDADLSKVLIYFNELNASTPSAFKFKKITGAYYYLIMNFSCGYDETDDASELLGKIFISKMQPLSASDFKVFERLAKLNGNAAFLQKLNGRKGHAVK